MHKLTITYRPLELTDMISDAQRAHLLRLERVSPVDVRLDLPLMEVRPDQRRADLSANPVMTGKDKR